MYNRDQGLCAFKSTGTGTGVEMGTDRGIKAWPVPDRLSKMGAGIVSIELETAFPGELNTIYN